MLKFVVAFLESVALSSFSILYNVFSLIFIHNGSLSFSMDAFLVVYIFALPPIC
ncbi:hypothetical protein NSQ77_10945 [Oceanobacillus sp. FSL K6-2867]|uniref:hypothetical protein n=1 Tax=Oceanobacillus sp. FSL K6-2867 TaxID=2954748 RepID=UPI0030CAA527